jgi:hypothetical protein
MAVIKPIPITTKGVAGKANTQIKKNPSVIGYFFFAAGPNKSLKSIIQQETPVEAHMHVKLYKAQTTIRGKVDIGLNGAQKTTAWMSRARKTREVMSAIKMPLPITNKCADERLTFGVGGAGVAGVAGVTVSTAGGWYGGGSSDAEPSAAASVVSVLGIAVASTSPAAGVVGGTAVAASPTPGVIERSPPVKLAITICRNIMSKTGNGSDRLWKKDAYW